MRRALRLRWQGEASHDETVKRFLYDCHERGRWIQCDCSINPATEARPLLAVRRTEASITLARMTGSDRVVHHEHCIFNLSSIDIGADDALDVPINEAFGLSRAARKREIEPRLLDRPKAPPSFYQDPGELRLGAQDSQPVAPLERSNAPQEHTPENNHIGRRMIYLLESAGSNLLCRTDNHPAAFRQVLEFCKQVPTPNGGSLYNLIQARPHAFENGFLRNCARAAANQGLSATCWWICPIEDFNPERGVFLANDADAEIIAPVPGHIRFFGCKIEAVVTQFPALMLARCDETGILDAYAHPILAVNRWCLVDSHLERTVINEIRALLPTLADEHGLAVSIHKPLYHWLATGERPDVVLRTITGSRDYHMVIEIMGFTDPEYQDRKRKLRLNVLATPRCSYVEDRRALDPQQPTNHLVTSIDAWLHSANHAT